MRLDGLGKPPLAQAQSSNIVKSRVQRLTDKEVKEVMGAEGPDVPDPEGDQDSGRLGQIIELLERNKGRKGRRPFKKALGNALRVYQKVAQAEEIENQTGKALDKRA